MTCFVDLGALLGLSILWSRVTASLRKKQLKRLQELQDLARRNLGHELTGGGGSAVEHSGLEVALLSAVRQYEDIRAAAMSTECAPPTTAECFAATPGLKQLQSLSGSIASSVTPLLQRAGMARSQDEDVEVEDLVCADVRHWLGCTQAAEVEQRLHFYRQLLMRPEVFGEDPHFFQMLACLCEGLEDHLSRLSGSSRDCAKELSKVISMGKELMDALLPVLLLSICDLLDGPAPLISVEAILNSMEVDSPGFPKRLWESDCGRILHELLQSQHFKDLWGLKQSHRPVPQRGRTKLLDLWLELRHGWVDSVDGEEKLSAASGVHELFRSEKSREVQQHYLDLYKQLDNFIKFLSMVAIYKSLATVAGDAAMYHLRSTLHHLLQEIEISVASTLALLSRIMQEVRKAVMNVTSCNAKAASGSTLAWLGRLQVIDELAVARSANSLLEAVQTLRFLSSETRLPELQNSCRRGLQQICDLTSSIEFRSRCAEVPPSAPAISAESFVGSDVATGSPRKDMLEDVQSPAASPNSGNPQDIEAPATASTLVAEKLEPEPAPLEKLLGRECDQEEQDRFYDLLLAAVLPLLGDGTSLAAEQAVVLLQKGGLSEAEQEMVANASPLGCEEVLDGDDLRRVLESMARVQDGEDAQSQGILPRRVPRIKGVTWDGSRLRMGESFYS